MGKINKKVRDFIAHTVRHELEEDYRKNYKKDFVSIGEEVAGVNRRVAGVEAELTNMRELLSENGSLGYNYVNSEILLLSSLPEIKRKKILIVGFYGAPNLGDEFMMETLVEYLSDDKRIDLTIMLCDSPKYRYPARTNINYIHYPKTQVDFHYLSRFFDVLIIGGGACIDDAEYSKSDSYRYDYATIALKMSLAFSANDRKVLFLGVSSNDKLEDAVYFSHLKEAIDASTYFSVRDKNSQLVIRKHIDTNKIDLLEDLALANKSLSLGRRGKVQKNNIGLVWICSSENMHRLKELVGGVKAHFSEAKEGYRINLIPFYGYANNDTEKMEAIAKEIGDESVVVENLARNMEEAVEMLSKNEVIVAERYHAILLAYALGVKCVPILFSQHRHYGNKVKYLNEQFGKDILLDSSKSGVQDIVGAIIGKLRSKEEGAGDRQAILGGAQEHLEAVLKKFL